MYIAGVAIEVARLAPLWTVLVLRRPITLKVDLWIGRAIPSDTIFYRTINPLLAGFFIFKCERNTLTIYLEA